MIDPIESQQEYVKAVEHGYQYARHGAVSMYLFRADQMEPTIMEKMTAAPFYVWVFRNCTLASCRAPSDFVIEPCTTPIAWLAQGDRMARTLDWA
jgi:hypothetical protein